jgi:methionyl aminopeptidase
MDDAIYENYKRAGKIAAEARTYGITLIKPGVRLLDVATMIEKKIEEKGAGLAFPVNIACNNLAAHYTPRHDDPLIFHRGDVVKLDVGAHIEGYIADTAVTIELDTHLYDTMIQASARALEQTITILHSKTPLNEVGKTIEQTISSYGYKPIDNLMGHGLARYELHSGLSVPNVGAFSNKIQPKEGDVIAIEPFATNGAGHVISGDGSNIYLCKDTLKTKLIRETRAKILFEKIQARFGTLPFAQRWFHELFPKEDLIMRKLSFLGAMKQYPQLVEAKGGIVTQKEHTVIVRDDGCEVIT